MATKIEEIKELMKKSLNIKELKEEDTLATYGLDSLDVVEFILDLEEKFDISFQTDDTKDIKTVGDLLKTIEKKIV